MIKPIKKIYEFTLDLKRESNVQLKGVVDGDTGIVLQIRLTSDGQPLEAEDIDVARIVLNVRSNSGWRSQDSSINGSGFTISGGLITIELFSSTYSEGNNYAQLEIYTAEREQEDTLVTTQQFTFNAKKGTQGEIQSSDALPSLTKAINAVYAALNDLYKVAGQRENLLEDAIPMTDSISETKDTIWTVSKSTGLELPEITENKWIMLAFPGNRSQKMHFTISRIQSESGIKYGHASFLESIKKGITVTISFDVLTDTPLDIEAGIENGESFEVSASKVAYASDEWQTVEFSLEMPEDWDASENGYLYIKATAPTGTAASYASIRYIKAEKSDIASGWTPAAQDLKNLFAESIRTAKQTLSPEEKTQALENLGIFRGYASPESMVDKMDNMDLYIYFEEA